MQIADLHIHSKYSRATSRDCDTLHLDQWARNKGIHIVGTGDFTHPGWRRELRESLLPAEEGLYTLKPELVLPAYAKESGPQPRFVVTGEISTIYKKNGKTRKVHHVIILPSIEAAEKLSHRLEAIGNLHSDGRPILGLDSHDLLEITLESCPEALYIPAHIWTPHFSLFGAFSGFDTLEECYEDLSPYVRALETGLSSDPTMNRLVSALDGYTLVSNSDAHSPGKLGREANLLDVPLSYSAMKHAIQTGDGFAGTLEFFPEEGKYHLDGHRDCKLCLTPEETLRLNGLCPVCGKKITIGVLHRVNALADRTEKELPKNIKPFESLIPLPELIASCTGFSVISKKTQARYIDMLGRLGDEFSILRSASFTEIESVAGFAIAEGIRRMRVGDVRRRSGFDGEFGVISLFDPHEREELEGQLSLLPVEKASDAKIEKTSKKAFEKKASSKKKEQDDHSPTEALNASQLAAVQTQSPHTAVIAGPGTGKTKTLVSRIAFLIEEMGVHPSDITAVTFTRQAAAEMKERLTARLGRQKLRDLTVGTFHSICLGLLPPKPLLTDAQALDILREVLLTQGSDAKPSVIRQKISMVKNGKTCMQANLDEAIFAAYAAKCENLGVRDMDDLLLDCLAVSVQGKRMFTHLLVDEFQDINPVQHQLVLHWAAGEQTLFVIGDPDQSIYGFRGSNARCFAELAEKLPDLEQITLEQNYRSSPEILQNALSVIAHNPGGTRQLLPNRPPHVPVQLVRSQEPWSQYIWIAKEIGRMVGGVDMISASAGEKDRHALRSFSDIAVLCRTRHQLEQLEGYLLHDDIPCVIHGREDYLSDKRVLGTLGFFASLSDPQNSLLLLDALRAIWRVPKALAQRAAHAAAGSTQGGSFDVDALRTSLGEFLPLALWLEAVTAYLPRIAKEKPRLLLQSWVDTYGKNAAMERLLQASSLYETMDDFCNALLFGQEADIRRTSTKVYAKNAVRLMTLHGSKGLEFPVVFLACDHMAIEDHTLSAAELQEERRLFFVGMTRAREELILTGAQSSLFWNELADSVKRETLPARSKLTQGEQLSLF